MEIAFNELSFIPFSKNERELEVRYLQMLKTFAFAKEEFGFEHLVFPENLAEIEVLREITFYVWMNSLNGISKQAVSSVIRKPFDKQSLDGLENEKDAYFYTNTELGILEKYCIGMGIAYSKGIICISIINHDFWKNDEISIFHIEHEDKTFPVRNIYEIRQVGSTAFKQFVESIQPVVLTETTLSPLQKSYSLREDHGKDKLIAFSKKIFKSPYVEGVINSLPFNPRTTLFIKDIKPNGLIEIVLHWNDSGIGLVVKSTGRNYQETKKIAQILRDEYDK